MPDQPTRRQIISAAALGAASLAVPSLSAAQSGQDVPLDHIEKQLASPLSAEAKKLLTESLKGVQTAASDRLKTKLPENSEPCFNYSVTPVKAKVKK